MSYDYVALVEEISSHRRRATKLMDGAADRDGLLLVLQESLKAMETLSSHCPMTPLLWMKYAWDTSQLIQVAVSKNSNEGKLAALQTRLQTLELGLEEFPGSSILHLHYVELLLTCMEEDVDKKRQALESAIQLVGRGSHRQDGEIIAQLYRLYSHFLAKQGDFAGACAVCLQRAQTPVEGANDSFADEFGQFCKLYKQDSTPYMAQIELARRTEAKLYHSLLQFEQDVEFAMMQEQIRCESSSLIEVDNVGNPLPINADLFLQEGERPPSHWMGLGGMVTADAFRKYAQACHRFQLRYHQTEGGDEEESEASIKKQEDKIHQLTCSVYERGVAECPTVESLWQSYIQHLFYQLEAIQESVQDDPNKVVQVAEQLRRVTARAVRNCPYSLSLFQKKLRTFLIVANLGHAVLDPDDIMQTVQEALDARFLQNPGQCVDLYLSAIRVVKQRIIFLVAPPGLAYDEGEPPPSEKKMEEEQAVPPLDDDRLQDLQDLCEDLREIYDVADEQLRKRHIVWTEGRSLLWQDKAVTEAFLISPLMMKASTKTKDNTQQQQQEALLRKAYERLVRVHQPPHPDSYQSYINFLYSTIVPHEAIVSKLQKIRGVYEKALRSVGKSKPKLDPPPYSTMTVARDYETALCSLCHEYLNFERCFGSEKSLKLASLAVQKKMEKADIGTTVSNKEEEPNQQADSVEEPQTTSLKRKHEDPNIQKDSTIADGDSLEPAAKKQKSDSSPTSTPVAPPSNTSDENVNDVSTKPVGTLPSPKVKVGNLMYPAHPFTVRISNLSYETEDMDLVDLLRPRCGAVVHARIIRDKKGGNKKGSSKGWALVQFEERDSVESALQLNDILGINEKLISVERSHLPAVSVIPPGMHRVQPQGEGKSTKRNQKRKEQRKERNFTQKQPVGTESEAAAPVSSVPKEDGIDKKQTTSAASILAFRPRGITQKGNKKAHPKPRLQLETNEADK